MSSKDVEVSYAAPEPIELPYFTHPTAGRSAETYWRWGYQVAGANPIMVNEHCRTERQAEGLARNKAAEIHKELAKLHAPAEVFWWTQKWHISTAVNYEKQQTGPL